MLLVSVKRGMNREWKRFSFNNMQQTETRIQMIIKMVNEFILTVIYFSHKPDAKLCMRVNLGWTKKNCGKSGLGHWASGPPGFRAFGQLRALAAGCWAVCLLLASIRSRPFKSIVCIRREMLFTTFKYLFSFQRYSSF